MGLDGLSLNEDAPPLLPAPGAAAMEDAVWPDAGGSGCWCLALTAEPGAFQTLVVVPVLEGRLFHVPNCRLATWVMGTRHHFVFQP